MSQPVKYLKIVGELLSLYQRELIRLARKHPHELSTQFSKHFSSLLDRLRQTETHKAIDDALSPHCGEMVDFLRVADRPQLPYRLNKTSIDQRKNLRSQAGTRLMRMTGGLRRSGEAEPIEEQPEFADIIQSYKIEEELVPRMRMKWKSAYEPEQKGDGKDISTIGNNNIDLLSYTIPQIENSIRRLSLQRSPKTTKERELEFRTLQSRSNKKNYIPRLF